LGLAHINAATRGGKTGRESSTGQMLLSNGTSAFKAFADITFSFGQTGDIPLAGDWDGKPSQP
jgi:hypothetical protein